MGITPHSNPQRVEGERVSGCELDLLSAVSPDRLYLFAIDAHKESGFRGSLGTQEETARHLRARARPPTMRSGRFHS